MNTVIPIQERLIVALDVPSLEEARRYVKDLEDVVWFYKIGLELFLAVNVDFIRELRARNCRIFLDLKMNDIDETVRRAVNLATNLDVDFLTIFGNHATAKAAVLGRGVGSLKILTVPLLSSWGERDLQDLGMLSVQAGVSARFHTLDDYVLWRADMAMAQGCDGLIASGKYVAILRERFGEKALIVSPGVRPAGQNTHEHQRSLTPFDAIQAGADYLVVGRPIRDAANRRKMAEVIQEEIALAVKSGSSKGHSTSRESEPAI
ncbi:MAG: orotidine-5'-phosphate decarboxylase [Nitrospira sp.]|nr:orotidine-5'-phosphate decarboxylase [Nitrospira sp.]